MTRHFARVQFPLYSLPHKNYVLSFTAVRMLKVKSTGTSDTTVLTYLHAHAIRVIISPPVSLLQWKITSLK
jgi:hypothetical protein